MNYPFDPDVLLRDNKILGDQDSGLHEVSLTQLRQYLKWLERSKLAGYAAAASQAELEDISVGSSSRWGVVRGAENKLENGYYLGNSETDKWKRVSGITDTFAVIEDVTGGNSITGKIDSAIYSGDVKLFAFVPVENNSGPVDLDVDDGRGSIPLRSATGNELSENELRAGQAVVFLGHSEKEYRVLMSGSKSSFDHQGDWSAGEQYAEGQIVTGADHKWYQLQMPNAIGVDPIGDGTGAWVKILSPVANHDAIIVPGSQLARSIEERLNDLEVNVLDFGADRYGTHGSSTAFQRAIDFAYAKGISKVRVPWGIYLLTKVVYLPFCIQLVGAGRHSWAREYGDITAGSPHPLLGSTLLTNGPGVKRLFSDRSGDGSDEHLAVAFAIMGESASIRNLSIYTPVTDENWDVAIYNCGVSSVVLEEVDVRGSWALAAEVKDPTWGRDNPRMMAIDHAPDWFDQDYKNIYDFGLTNCITEKCNFEGGRAVFIDSGGDNFAYAVNGISDSKYINCRFYNDGPVSGPTLAMRNSDDGALIRINYRLDSGLEGAQGLAFIDCRYDPYCRWWLDLGWVGALDIGGVRSYNETAESWQEYIQDNGGSVAQKRARLNVSMTRTKGPIRFYGALRFGIAQDYNDEGTSQLAYGLSETYGRNMEFISPCNFMNTPNLRLGGWNDTKRFELNSYDEKGAFKFFDKSGVGGLIATLDNEGIEFSGVAHLKRSGSAHEHLKLAGADLRSEITLHNPTADGSNLNMDTNTGALRLSTSSTRFKREVESMSLPYAQAIVMESRPVWYRSRSDSDDSEHSFWGFISEELAEIDPRLVSWRRERILINGEFVDYGEPRPYCVFYDRFVPALVKVMQGHQQRIDDLVGRVQALESARPTSS
ncbi:Pectate lyase superfamily protein [Pseudovibrio sp. Ad5]|uniref:hypothetical protein n=1 Tax=Pseudovibrio sp. Ad5 TaxID=989436 RepID=UPI0007AE5659|nr:hypothetical protein [Pseudovibrio sp. Ad5]KZK96345.1 Pectate lyase superfamily protein [Pseudovibrio sp. Ad5]